MRFNIFEEKIDWHNHKYCILELRDGLTIEEINEKYSWIYSEEKIWSHAVLGLKETDGKIFLKWYTGLWRLGKWDEGWFVNSIGREELRYTLKMNLNLNGTNFKSKLYPQQQLLKSTIDELQAKQN